MADENKRNVEQTQELAISNYKTFIHTAENSRSIFTEFQNTEEQVSTLLDKLPVFTAECENFLAKAEDLNEERRINSITLKKNAQLLEILELPQLMERCIREGRYEEALELASYVQKLGHNHSDIPIIKVRVCFFNAIIYLNFLIINILEYCTLSGGAVAYNVGAISGAVAHRLAIAQMLANCWLFTTHAGI